MDGRKFPDNSDDARIPPGNIGIRLALVQPDTGADRAGLQKGDIIVALDGVPLPGSNRGAFTAFSKEIRGRGPGAQINLTVLRGSVTVDILATLGPVPKDRFEQANGVRALVQEADRRFDLWWARYFRPGLEASTVATDP